MNLAPQPALSGRLYPLSNGIRGVQETITVMRAEVKKGRVDPVIRQAATTLIYLTPQKCELSEIEAVFNFVRDRVRYTRDIVDVETVSSARKTLEGRIGDCDDQSVLLAALLEAVGYSTRFVVAGYNTATDLEHVYTQVFIGDQWIDADPTEPHPLGWCADGATVAYTEFV